VCWLYTASYRYRRLTLWLPHGLAKDASLADVKASISICCLASPSGSLDSSCSNQPFELTRPAPAVLSMRVPALNPGQRCIVRVKADPKVRTAVWWQGWLGLGWVGGAGVRLWCTGAGFAKAGQCCIVRLKANPKVRRAVWGEGWLVLAWWGGCGAVVYRCRFC
jgi:hypothetical protein